MVLIVYEHATGEAIFTEKNLAKMREVEEKITTHPDYPKYCKRADKTGKSTACQAPLSPLRLFYADLGNQASAEEIVASLDEIDGTKDGNQSLALRGGRALPLPVFGFSVSRAAPGRSSYFTGARSSLPRGRVSCGVCCSGARVSLRPRSWQYCPVVLDRRVS